MKFNLFAIAMMFASSVWAQTDITSQYLQNPSFESDDISSLSAVINSSDGLRGYTLNNPKGWTVSGTSVTELLVTKDCYTDNNFGKVTTIPDGSQAYYLRQGWSTGTTTMTQSLTLPAGKYRFAFDTRSGYANSATSTLKITAGSESNSNTFTQGSSSCFTTMAWTTQSVDFTLSASSTINVGVTITWVSGGSCVMFDNVRLYDITNVEEKPDPTEESVSSPTEGVITNDFVQEADMKSDLLQMLAKFSTYMVNDWNQCAAPNSINESCGFFKGENSGGNNEQGVRPNADLSMICAFLVKYGKPAGVTLPTGVTWDKLEELALKSLIFAYSTHKANKLKVCSGNNYWGSTSTSDYVWESSLWAMSVAYSAYFQWDKLTDAQKNYIYAMLKAECNYELNRSIPTGYSGDTKAEENGWEADILAATLGLFPNDDLAPKWFARLREFAINSYSHTSDAANTTIIDPDYDNTTVADLYKGQNLYDDYSLQNHNLFHTSYQNVVMQELGEAALALKMFQLGTTGVEKWKTNALMHNNQQVQDSILNWLALADGELAMPNGNDWSLFLYDQITSYTTQACFQRDPNALMQENLAYKYIKARQQTTTDGSWLLRADVGARRMGVEAHRVMMTYLMHDQLSTADLTPTAWDDFNKKFSTARMIPCQNIVRAATDDRFTCFSWSDGLKSYTGYFAANKADKNKIVVPYRANNTGNITGWYEVSGKSTDASPVVKGIYNLQGNGYTMNGEMNVNGSSLNNRFAIYSTPRNAIIYLDYVTANSACTITAEKGGLLAVSTDELTKLARTLYYSNSTDDGITHKQTDGSTFATFKSNWVNIDNEIGVVSVGNGKKIAFGDRGANNSIYTSKLYPMYSNDSRSVAANDVVDARNLVYYNNITAEATKDMSDNLVPLRSLLPEGWNGIIALDTDQNYLFISNFKGTSNTATVSGIQYMNWAPIFNEQTTITDSKSTATFKADQNNSIGEILTAAIQGTNVTAQMESLTSVLITATEDATINFAIIQEGQTEPVKKEITLKKGETVRAYIINNEVCVENASMPIVTPTDYTGYIVNPSFEGNATNGWEGSPTVNYNCAEKFNTTFDINQTIKGLPAGNYILTCQGFYRDGGYDTAASHRTAGTEALNAVLYANDASIPLVSILDEANEMGAVGEKQSTYGYIPNTMEQSSIYFSHNLYPNSLTFSVAEGEDVKIGVKKTVANTNDWTIFDNFTLTRITVTNVVKVIDELKKGNTSYTIEDVNKMSALALGKVYTLEGKRLNAISSPGIYIINGNKVMVK